MIRKKSNCTYEKSKKPGVSFIIRWTFSCHTFFNPNLNSGFSPSLNIEKNGYIMLFTYLWFITDIVINNFNLLAFLPVHFPNLTHQNLTNQSVQHCFIQFLIRGNTYFHHLQKQREELSNPTTWIPRFHLPQPKVLNQLWDYGNLEIEKHSLPVNAQSAFSLSLAKNFLYDFSLKSSADMSSILLITSLHFLILFV